MPSLPLVQTVAVNDRNGGMLLTANIFPVPRDGTFNDREWMQALRRPDAPPVHVSRVYRGRLDGFLFFAVSRRRSPANRLSPGEFDGAINVSVRPSAVAAGFDDVVTHSSDVVALLRDDGELLVRRPVFDAPPNFQVSGEFKRFAASGRVSGQIRIVSRVDGAERLIAVRRLQGFPIYATAGREVATIVSAWGWTTARQLAFGVPAMMLMAAFAVMALRRTREALRAQESLSAEAARRGAAEELERRHTLLLREMEHRYQNTMSVVQSMLRLSLLRAGEEARRAADAAMDRIAALGRAQALLATRRWQGVDLAQLIRSELVAFAEGDMERIKFQGPPLKVSADKAEAISLIIHELATNAAKYGALSAKSGRVSIRWAVDEGDGSLALVWKERGGPALADEPERSGFGTRLIEILIAKIGGSVSRRWNATGLRVQLRLPLDDDAKTTTKGN